MGGISVPISSVEVDPSVAKRASHVRYRGGEGERAVAADAPQTRAGLLMILIVEDDRDNRDLLCDVLSAEGYVVAMAADGQQALDHLERGGRPALVLLDLVLPKVSGWDVLRYMREDPELRKIPVVVLTALPNKQLRAVADVILIKPSEPRVVLQTIVEVIASHAVAP